MERSALITEIEVLLTACVSGRNLISAEEIAEIDERTTIAFGADPVVAEALSALLAEVADQTMTGASRAINPLLDLRSAMVASPALSAV